MKGYQKPEEQEKGINNRLNEFEKNVEDINLGQEQIIDYEIQRNIKVKTGSLIQRILKLLSQAAETTSTFAPLSPFSRLICKSIGQLIDEISKRKKL